MITGWGEGAKGLPRLKIRNKGKTERDPGKPDGKERRLRRAGLGLRNDE